MLTQGVVLVKVGRIVHQRPNPLARRTGSVPAGRGVLPASVFLNSLLAADGSAPWRDADVLAPCMERVLVARRAGEAGPPRNQNSSPGEERSTKASLKRSLPVEHHLC